MKRYTALFVLIVFFIFLTLSLSSASGALDNSNLRYGVLEGYLIDKDDNSLVIEEYGGVLYLLSLSDNANLQIDKRPVSFSDFIPGMEIYLQVRDGYITHLEGFSSVHLGYISPGSKLRTGTIINIDRNQLKVRLKTGEEETYFTSVNSLVLKNGQRVALSSLYVGDNVKLYFDEVDTNIAGRVEVEGDSVLIKNIYKGNLNIINGFNNSISLENVQIFRNGKWQKHDSYLSFPFNRETPVFVGGFAVDLSQLKYYAGSNVYIVTKDYFGTERIERLLVQNRHESMYTDKIVDLNWYTGAFELGNTRNFSFNESTIFVKSRRIVDPYSLTAGFDAVVISDGSVDNRTAGIVYILNEEINHSNAGNHYLYAGRLDMILEDMITLEDFYLLNKNSWEGFDDEKKLYYDNDTHVYDLENKKLITNKELYSGNYSVDEDSDYAEDNNLRNWYAYAYTEGDRIAVLGVKEKLDSLLKQRVTNGAISQLEDDIHVGWTIRLVDANDWSNRHEKWMSKNSSLRVNLEEAIIIKDGKLIEPFDLQVGNRLYLVRDDFEARVVIVK